MNPQASSVPAGQPATPRRRAASRSGGEVPRPRGETPPPDLSALALEQISRQASSPRSLISKNFALYELTRSELASRQAIDNSFENDQHLRAAINLARQVLQPIRDAFGSFTPNSVYRGQKLERALKNKPSTWLSTSQHTRGEACDIEIPGMATLALASWARDHLADFDQIICECYDPRQGPNSGWVHVSLKAPGSGSNRRQCLSYVCDPGSGQLVYVQGLQAAT